MKKLPGLPRAVKAISSIAQLRIACAKPPFVSVSRRCFSSQPFLLADIGEGIAEVELLQWFVNAGDEVKQFDKVCEVQSDKATVEITSRYDGVIESLNGEVGDMMIVGEPLMMIAVEGSDGGVEPAEKVTTDEPGEMKTKLSIPSPVGDGSGGMVQPRSGGKILTTPAVRKMAKENNIDLSAVGGSGPNGRILKEDILRLLSGGGSTLQQPASPARPAFSSPSPASPATPAEPQTFKPLPTRPSAGERREPVRGYGRLMVQSMNESLKIPHFGYSDEVSMGKLDDLRKELKVIGEQYGVKMSYMPIMIKAASIALNEYPILNSSLSDDESEIIFKGDHNIGVAMDTDKGLVVPNIKGVQGLSILEIAGELNRLQADGQGGAGIASKDLEGTTFTLSNIGAIGGTYMEPVIAKPQVAIGALGKIQTLPRFDEDGDVVAEKIMAVSWAGDHRVVDGATMARFSNRWKEMLENPGLMIATLT